MSVAESDNSQKAVTNSEFTPESSNHQHRRRVVLVGLLALLLGCIGVFGKGRASVVVVAFDGVGQLDDINTTSSGSNHSDLPTKNNANMTFPDTTNPTPLPSRTQPTPLPISTTSVSPNVSLASCVAPRLSLKRPPPSNREFQLFPNSGCKCRYEPVAEHLETATTTKRNFTATMSAFLYGQDATQQQQKTVKQRRILVLGDSLGRYVFAEMIHGMMSASGDLLLPQDLRGMLQTASNDRRGDVPNPSAVRAPVIEWPHAEMVKKLREQASKNTPSPIDRLPAVFRFEMNPLISKDRNLTILQQFRPTHIIVSRGMWDISRMVPSNPRRYYNELQALLEEMRNAFPTAAIYVYGLHKLTTSKFFFIKKSKQCITARATLYRDTNYCAVKRFNSRFQQHMKKRSSSSSSSSPTVQSVHYLDMYAASRAFGPKHTNNGDGIHYVNHALTSMTQFVLEAMVAVESTLTTSVPSPSSVFSFPLQRFSPSMASHEAHLCGIGVKDEENPTNKVPCTEETESAFEDTTRVAFELSQSALLAGREMHLRAGTTFTASSVFPSTPLVNASDVENVVKTKTLTAITKTVSMAAYSCTKLLLHLYFFGGLVHAQRWAEEMSMHSPEDRQPWIAALADTEAFHAWLRGNEFIERNDETTNSSQRLLLYANAPHSVLALGSQCVDMLQIHVFDSFFTQLLWPLSTTNQLIDCEATTFIPIFQTRLQPCNVQTTNRAPHCQQLQPVPWLESSDRCGQNRFLYERGMGRLRQEIERFERKQRCRSSPPPYRSGFTTNATIDAVIDHCPHILRVAELLSSKVPLRGERDTTSRRRQVATSLSMSYQQTLQQFPLAPFSGADIGTSRLEVHIARCEYSLRDLLSEPTALKTFFMRKKAKESRQYCKKLQHFRDLKQLQLSPDKILAVLDDAGCVGKL